MKIISPSSLNEEKWNAGTTHTIRWIGGDNNKNVSISFNGRNTIITKNTGSYDWNIPSDFSPGQYSLDINFGDVDLESSPFLIFPPAASGN